MIGNSLFIWTNIVQLDDEQRVLYTVVFIFLIIMASSSTSEGAGIPVAPWFVREFMYGGGRLLHNIAHIA